MTASPVHVFVYMLYKYTLDLKKRYMNPLLVLLFIRKIPTTSIYYISQELWKSAREGFTHNSKPFIDGNTQFPFSKQVLSHIINIIHK